MPALDTYTIRNEAPWRLRPVPTDQGRTFGFEAEFATEGPRLAEALGRTGFWQARDIHGWHCGCDSCEDSVLKVQHDATASCEVISSVLNDFALGNGEFREITLALEQCAIEVGAVPGMGQGLHVHVNRPPHGWRALSYAAFVVMERALYDISRGRFTNQRTFNSEVTRWLSLDDEFLDASYLQGMYQDHRDADRHSNLCVNTRFDTWEYRLWASTRSAWRMEMCVRASLALSDPALVVAALDTWAAGEPFQLADLFNTVDTRLAELTEKQQAYLAKLGGAQRDLPFAAPSVDALYGAGPGGRHA